jgi:hypothetical protein
MTPQERQRVERLFERLSQLENSPREREAEKLIAEGLRAVPNAPYALIQTVLVQEEALARANERIRQLEGGEDEESEAEGGSFLDTLRGALSGQAATPTRRSSVPSTRGPDAPMGVPPALQHLHPRRARAQSQERRSRHSARQLVVFTGLSGSGKSRSPSTRSMPRASGAMSRALSAYARQFLEMMQKPDVDQIDGLSPAISIEQKTTSRTRARPSAPSPRSTTTCGCCGRASACPIRRRPACRSRARRVSQMVDRVLALPEGTRLYLLAPVVRGRKGEYRKELADF